MSTQTESPAHAALRAAGYKEVGSTESDDALDVRWEAARGDMYWLVTEHIYGPRRDVPHPHYTMQAIARDDGVVGVPGILTPADLAARLPELEARALAAMRALRGEGT